LNFPEEKNVSYSKMENYVTGMLKMESPKKKIQDLERASFSGEPPFAPTRSA